MTAGDVDRFVLWLVVLAPFVDWSAWAVLHATHRRYPDIRTLAERARIALAIAIGTTLVWPISLMAVGIMPRGFIPSDLVVILLGAGLLAASAVNAWWALRIVVAWLRDRRDGQ